MDTFDYDVCQDCPIFSFGEWGALWTYPGVAKWVPIHDPITTRGYPLRD
jgi:hypothetical protein